MRRLALLLIACEPSVWAQAEFFEARIRPQLVANCYACHDSKKAASGLKLDSKTGLERGGSRGTAISPGNPDGSLLYRAISYRDAELKMPPGGKLPDDVIADFREWIRQGAEDPRTQGPAAAPQPSAIDWDRARKHWSFQPVRASQPPKPRNRAWVRSPIDAFILAGLESANLSPAPAADKLTLLRRVTFDLTGLPPSPQEIEAFLKDNSAAAFEKVVDRLLQSPHYGERWARHWLDLVRFAETNGHEFDFYKDEAWRYRDYVIHAFNEDLPYNQFVLEHIAGDGLPQKRLSPDRGYWESPLASGFFGLGEERNGATDLEEVRSEMRDSKIDVFGKAFLGLTVACARCHDHKFDPISNADYYALGGIFDSTRTTLGTVSSPAVTSQIERIVSSLPRNAPVPPQPLKLREGDELVDIAQFYQSGSAFAEPNGGRLDSSRGVSDKLTGILVSRSFVPTKRYIHVRLAGSKFKPVREEPSQLAVTIFAPGRYPKGVAGDGDRTLRWKTITLQEEVNQVCYLEIADRRRDGHIVVDAIVLSGNKQPPETPEETLPVLPEPTPLEASIPEEVFGRVSYEDVPHNLHIHERGNHLNLGAEVPRRQLQILDGTDAAPYSHDSGRLALARVMTNPANPLLARVMVNRIWKHHFGEGLVRTVDNFGKTGERPSHPELLDYLATQFVNHGWSLKAMHRMIVLSGTYQMASTASAAAEERDPQNRLLSHMSVRRLDAESIRDAVLAVSGSLDETACGPSVRVHVSPYQDGRGKPASGPLDGNGRRSIYLEVRRNFLTPLLLAFDYPLPATTAGRRSVSTVPAQALTLMNNEFIAEQAKLWATRMESTYMDPRARLDAMFLRVFGRMPEPAERDRVQTFLGGQGSWEDLAHVLFNAKEFLFLR